MHSRRRPMSVLAATALAAAAFGAAAQDRMPPLSAADLTEQQAQALAAFVAARGEPTAAPWAALLRSPELMTHTHALGDYLDFQSALPGYLRELVILLTAREWAQSYVWSVHLSRAIDEGFSAEMARAIGEGRRPEGMVEEEEILYEFCMELQRNRSVSDATYEKTVSRFGEQGVVEAVSLMGYYTMVSMLSNVSRAPLPAGVSPAFAALPY
jgi:4-carboxymuconolactone decarboxylase